MKAYVIAAETVNDQVMFAAYAKEVPRTLVPFGGKFPVLGTNPHSWGLPTQDAYMSVLREAMARDTLDPVGITFGTATGQVWHSSDEGVSWRMITDTLPEIWAVEASVVD